MTTKHFSKATALIIGSGIQGCTIALQLHRMGYRVKLVEQNATAYNQASLQQEGKVHLGFIYALDTSKKTTDKLLMDALQFGPIIEDLIGEKIDWNRIKSSRFDYIVARDSMMSSDSLLEHYEYLNTQYHNLRSDQHLHYLGERPQDLFIVPSRDNLTPYNQEKIVMVCPTQEYALRPEDLRQTIVDKIKSSPIEVITNHEVKSVQRSSYGFITQCLCQEQLVNLESDLVINAAWEEKRRIDHSMGLTEDGIWSLRVKMGLIFRADQIKKWNSFSMVLGSYGDLVVYPAYNEAYFSWYPECMLMQTNELELPSSWQPTLRSQINSGQLKKAIERSGIALGAILSSVEISELVNVKAGAILARGFRSIQDPSSDLHKRHDIPILADNGYFSINTGKFTSAPHNSQKLLTYL
ncbi:MAG: FAD-dependent oxidoreductase [Saprospiraceae bacterium]|nr:FAD-dependent oxidoreductase [Saprospiraceae bacterium]